MTWALTCAHILSRPATAARLGHLQTADQFRLVARRGTMAVAGAPALRLRKMTLKPSLSTVRLACATKTLAAAGTRAEKSSRRAATEGQRVPPARRATRLTKDSAMHSGRPLPAQLFSVFTACLVRTKGRSVGLTIAWLMCLAACGGIAGTGDGQSSNDGGTEASPQTIVSCTYDPSVDSEGNYCSYAISKGPTP